MRQIINTQQTQDMKYYEYNGRPLLFSKKTGYMFSDHESMDNAVNYFLSLDGFELLSKKEIKKEEVKEKKTDSNEQFFKKKDKKKKSKGE